MMKNKEIECCANCKHCIDTPKNNRYGDIEHFCMVSGYLMLDTTKDRNKVKHFTPGGKKLICKYERQI